MSLSAIPKRGLVLFYVSGIWVGILCGHDKALVEMIMQTFKMVLGA